MLFNLRLLSHTSISYPCLLCSNLLRPFESWPWGKCLLCNKGNKGIKGVKGVKGVKGNKGD